MRTDIPAKHVQEAMKLEAEGYVQLLRIDLRNPQLGSTYSLYLSQTKEYTWQNRTYTQWPFSIGETSVNSSGETTRPKLSVANPDGLWNRYIHQGWTDNATVTRYKILKSDLDANVNSFIMEKWRLSKHLSLTKSIYVAELRGALDGPLVRIPSDTYRPPVFPTVSVQ